MCQTMQSFNLLKIKAESILSEALLTHQSDLKVYFELKEYYFQTRDKDMMSDMRKNEEELKVIEFDEDGFQSAIDSLCDNLAQRTIYNTSDDQTTLPESILPMAFNTIPSFNFNNEKVETVSNFEFSARNKIPPPSPLLNSSSTMRKQIKDLSTLRQKRKLMKSGRLRRYQ